MSNLATTLAGFQQEISRIIAVTKVAAAAKDGDGAGAATSASRAVVGYAPPCASYDQLTIVQAVALIAESFDEAKSMDDIKDTKGRVATARKPLKELAAAVNGAAKELTMARDLASKPAGSSAGVRSKGRGKGRGKAGKGVAGDFSGATPGQTSSTTCPLLECGAENGVEITQVSTKDDDVTLADCDYSKPLLIKSHGVAQKMDDKAIQGILDSFLNESDKSAAKAKNGRGGMRCPASNNAVVQARECLAGILPRFVNTSSDEKLAPHLELSTFAVAKDQLKPFCEQDNLATLRYHKSGTKKVFMSATEDMMKYMVDVKQLAPAAVTPYRASLFMKVADKAVLVDYMSKHMIYHCTVAVSDILYTPAGFVVVEHTSQSCDTAGFCLRGVVQGDSRIAAIFPQLIEAAAAQPQAGKASAEVMQAARKAAE